MRTLYHGKLEKVMEKGRGSSHGFLKAQKSTNTVNNDTLRDRHMYASTQ